MPAKTAGLDIWENVCHVTNSTVWIGFGEKNIFLELEMFTHKEFGVKSFNCEELHLQKTVLG